MLKLRYMLIFAITWQCTNVHAQTLTGFGTKWNDDLTEWEIFTDDEELSGALKMTWQFQNDWTKWDFELDELRGKVIQPWENDKSFWEVRSFGEVITCRTAWRNDFTEWKLTDNNITLVLRTRYGNDPNEWVLRDEQHGVFAIYTSYEHDPRDWTIIDEMGEEVSMTMKIALMFIAVYHSLPIE